MSGGHHIRAIGPEQDEAGAHDASEIALPPVDTEEEDEVISWEENTEDYAPTSRLAWIWPVLATLTVLSWTAFLGWTHQAEILSGATPAIWIGWVGDWALPVLLVIGVWLIAMRSSRSEAARFADVANILSSESALLESRLVTVNRELSLAREFLSAESRELETLGRVAGTRIGEHADRLQNLIGENHATIEQIGTVSESALVNMDRLRDDLPVIANSARDTSNQIGAAGEEAKAQLEQLIAGFERLNVFGQASERQVASLSERVDAALSAFEAQAIHMGDVTSERFTALREASDDFRGDLDSREVESLAAMRRRMDSLGEEMAAASAQLTRAEEAAFDTMKVRLDGLSEEGQSISAGLRAAEEQAGESWARQVDALRERLGHAIEEIQSLDAQALESAQAKLAELRDEAKNIDAAMADRDAAFRDRALKRNADIASVEEASITALNERLATLDDNLAERQTRQAESTDALRKRAEASVTHMDALAERAEQLASQAADAYDRLETTGNNAATLLASAREDADTLRPAIEDLTDRSVRLLELIQAGSEHSRDILPASLEEVESRLISTREAGEALQVLLDSTGERSRNVSDYVLAARVETDRVDANLTSLDERIVSMHTTFAREVEALRETIATLERDSDAVGERASSVLRSSIEELDGKAREALSLADTESEKRLALISESIGERTAQAITNAVSEQSSRSIAELDLASASAAETARQAALQLRDQLSMVNELAGNLENRVSLARERAEEQVDNDFARRVALITEALNSNAIDIAKALSSDVTDMAWTSYLRGDRGIFTRRAVSLLDSTQSRDVAELYDSDPDFRDHVSRYIHDFEAMLRTMLSTRDGNALGVTLLSSDMGKLYVVLAQAIERLREN